MAKLKISVIIVTSGYDIFNPTPISQYDYKRYDNVIISLEFERRYANFKD